MCMLLLADSTYRKCTVLHSLNVRLKQAESIECKQIMEEVVYSKYESLPYKYNHETKYMYES